MTTPSISKIIARRYVLGRQGLWPGRRAAGKHGVAQVIRQIGAVQVDPINVAARSHDIVLWGRVAGYRPEHLHELLYQDRAFFDYGGGLEVYPIEDLPYWRVHMRRKGTEARWATFARSCGWRRIRLRTHRNTRPRHALVDAALALGRCRRESAPALGHALVDAALALGRCRRESAPALGRSICTC